MRLEAGTTLGRFDIVAPLAAGGMGEVYRARDRQLGRDLAVKILPADATTNAAAVERFVHEALSASALNHPNIVTIYDVGEADVGRYIAMELVRGKTFAALLGTSPSPESVAHLGAQAARALAVAHAAGIVHRDVKPDNLMVRDDGYVKVLDFGIARLGPEVHTSPAEPADPTMSGMVLGTVGYMSPEQACGDRVDSPTDVFSLGIVLYELLTSRHPFAADTAAVMLASMLTEVTPPASRFTGGIPERFDALLLEMLHKDPGRRPTARTVDAALSQLATRPAIAAASESEPIIVSGVEHRAGVGREIERAALRHSFDAARVGKSVLACVSGEPGLGKTTLVEDFLAELGAARIPHAIATGRCSERLAGTEAYLPLFDALDTLLRADAAARQAMRVLAPSWHAQVVGESVDTGGAPRHRAAGSQERMKRELAAFFQEVCRLRPLVLFLDDVHWADASTIDVVAYVLSRLESARLFVVVTYRPTELQLSRHPFQSLRLERQARRQSRDIELAFLSRDAIALLLDTRFPGHRFPGSFVDLIHRKTEGNPLFIVNLLSYLQERAVIRDEGGIWRIAGSIPDLAREIPESVRSMIERKIDQLTAEDRELLAASAVQGVEFDSAAIGTALSRDTAELESRYEVLDRVHGLVHRGEELEMPNGVLSVRYRFVHIFYHEALYASLSPSRRVALSGRVAAAVLDANRMQAAPVAAQLGFLFETARDYARAAEYFQMAATHATSISAHHEAVALARRSIAMLERLPMSGERLGRELASQITLGFSTATSLGYAMPEVVTALERAREIAEQLGERPQLVPALWGLWAYYCTRPQLQDAREMGERLLRIATTANDPMLLVAGHTALGIALQFLGHWEASHAHFERAVAVHDPSRWRDSLRLFMWEPGVLARSRMIRTAWLLGRTDEAIVHKQAALELARESGDPRTLALTLVFVTTGDQLLGRPDDALAHSKLGIAICDEHGIAQERAWLATYFGWAVAETQDADEGIRLMQASIATLRGMHAEITLPFYLGVLAETQAKHGHRADALRSIHEGLTVSRRTQDVGYDAYLLRLRGELELDESSLRDAIALAHTQGAQAYEHRAAIALGRLSA